MTTVTHTPLAAALPGLEACVHCGFCLPACPTYLVLGDENDSPRGRIVLMRAVIDGTLAVTDPAVETHLDRCLGCRACETACPSGVPYGAALEAARATLFEARRTPGAGREPAAARLLLWAIAHPTLFALAMAAGRALRFALVARVLARLPGTPGALFAMLAASEPAFTARPYVARGSGARGRVALLLGCVMDGLFAHVHAATRRTLVVNDYTMVPAPGQGCCGALHAHAGDAQRARAMARRTIGAFERSGAEFVAVDAAGCGAMMKEYGRLLADDPAWAARAHALAARVRDVTELLAAAGPRRGGEVAAAVTYDAPCHLQHAQRVESAPLAVLAAIPGLSLRPLTDRDQCCGSAGVYNIAQPALARAALAPKLAHIAATDAELVATGNPGCQMQIGAGLLRSGSAVLVVHPVELLDASYAARKAPERP